MGTTPQAIQQALQHGEVQAFGLAMPRLAPDWSPNGAANAGFKVNDEATMTMTASANWAAPLDMSYFCVDPAKGAPMPVTLIQAGGTVEAGAGLLLTLFDQPWVRLSRLYTQILETNNPNRPEWNRGLPYRPVPRYVFFPNPKQLPKDRNGLAEAWADLGFSGDARFYDGDGLPIDPVGVMAAFAAILTTYPVLQAVDLADPPVGQPFTKYLNTLAAQAKKRIRVVGPDGKPYDGTHLTGVTAVSQGSGLYDLTAPSVGLDAVGQSFTQDDHDRLVFGPATSGRLMNAFTPPTLPQNVTLARDFYTLRVVALKRYLIGAWPKAADDPAAGVQRQPAVRINENVTFLSDGNDVLGAINAALPGGSNPTLAVGQAMDGGFAIPPSRGMPAHWPNFPPNVPANPNATLPANLKKTVQLAANWATANPATLAKADAVLQIQGLPPNAWVRVYPRVFRPNATLARGDGHGDLVPANGTLSLYLKDPLSLRDPKNPAPGDVIVPAKATLMFDMALVLANGRSRIYGGLTVDVGAALATVPAVPPAANPCGAATYRGMSNAGILGLGTPGAVAPPANLTQWVQNLTGEVQPRDASRLPTMARRELLVAGANAGAWTGVIGGGRIAPETLSADARIGEPGGPGGRETSVTGATTHGGILAYDMARHAFRRSENIISRLIALANATWNVPNEPAAVGLGQAPGPTNGTFAGALLQTVAPRCETPELYAAWANKVDVNSAIQYVIDNFIPNNLPMRAQVVNALQNLKTTPAPPAPATESNAQQRMAVELEREITSVYYGRREAQWSLQSAIQSARHLIYIETPGFCSTAVGSPASGYAADLIDTLKTQLSSRPGLRLVICVPKNPDFAPGYEGMAAYEVQDRLKVVQGDPNAKPKPVTPLPPSQAIAFHPIGFPGRHSRVETTQVIVDDAWVMIGGCSIRRRGLTFDGSSDLVVTDTLVENGRSAAIRDFRRGVMANRLGITSASTHPSYVALSEAATAFRLVSDAVAAGGLGDISSVWDGITPGLPSATPLPADQANPDGRDLDYATALLVAALGAASGV